MKDYFVQSSSVRTYNDHVVPIKNSYSNISGKLDQIGNLYSFLETTFIKKGTYDEFIHENIKGVIMSIRKNLLTTVKKEKIEIICNADDLTWFVPKGVLLHVFYNLINNSLYWIDIRRKRAQSDRSYAHSGPDAIMIEEYGVDGIVVYDTGTGVSKSMEDRISLSEPLGLHQEQLMPTYMTTYYSKLQHFFNAVKALRMRAEDEFETVIAEEYSPRLLSFKDFDKTSETVSFDLRRVCRLTHDYVFYLYKLYLEYRGRKPFQTINLIRQEDTALPVLLNKKESGQYLSFRSVPNPNNNNRKNWCWIIDASELNRVLGLLGLPILSKPDQDVILKDDSTELNLEMGKKAKIVKAKQKVYFEYYSK